MRKFESIKDSKFGKKELRKIKGGLKATTTSATTNEPRRINPGGPVTAYPDSDDDTI